jgi:hypothetical protein
MRTGPVLHVHPPHGAPSPPPPCTSARCR